MFTTLIAKLKSLKEAISKKGLWPWIIGGFVAVGIAIVVFKLRQKITGRQKELAKLRTETEQAHAAAVAQTYKAELELNELKKLQLKAEAAVQGLQTKRELETINQEIAMNAATLKKLETVNTWEELDELNKRGR